MLKNGKGNIRRIGLGEDHLTKVEGIVKEREREEKGRKRMRGEQAEGDMRDSFLECGRFQGKDENFWKELGDWDVINVRNMDR